MVKFYPIDFYVLKEGVVLTGTVSPALDGYEMDKLEEVEVCVRDHTPKILKVRGIERFALTKECKQTDLGILF